MIISKLLLMILAVYMTGCGSSAETFIYNSKSLSVRVEIEKETGKVKFRTCSLYKDISEKLKTEGPVLSGLHSFGILCFKSSDDTMFYVRQRVPPFLFCGTDIFSRPYMSGFPALNIDGKLWHEEWTESELPTCFVRDSNFELTLLIFTDEMFVRKIISKKEFERLVCTDMYNKLKRLSSENIVLGPGKKTQIVPWTIRPLPPRFKPGREKRVGGMINEDEEIGEENKSD